LVKIEQGGAHTQPHSYQITVQGQVSGSWSDWFGGMALASRIEPGGAVVTILTGAVADQAALRGIVTRLWDLNLTLISLQTVDPAAAATGHKQESVQRSGEAGPGAGRLRARPHTDADGGAQQ